MWDHVWSGRGETAKTGYLGQRTRSQCILPCLTRTRSQRNPASENVYSHESWVEIYFRDTPPPSDTECLVNSGYGVQIQHAGLPFPALKLYWFYCHQIDNTFFLANSVF